MAKNADQLCPPIANSYTVIHHWVRDDCLCSSQIWCSSVQTPLRSKMLIQLQPAWKIC